MNNIERLIIRQFCSQLKKAEPQVQLEIVKELIETYEQESDYYLCSNIETLIYVFSLVDPIVLSVLLMNEIDRNLFNVLMNLSDFREMLIEKFEGNETALSVLVNI